MPQPHRDPIRDPVTLAASLFQEHLEFFRQQVIVSQEPERQARLGELPAAPIVQSVAAMIAAGGESNAPS